jgi:hypothetical protein
MRMSDDWDADEGFQLRQEPANWGTSQPKDEEPEEEAAPVVVTVDDEGRFSGVTVSQNWSSQVDARALGGEVQTAANKALVDYMAVAVEQNLGDSFDPNAQAATQHREAPSAHGDPSSATAKNLVAEILDLFGQFDAQFTEFQASLQQVAMSDHRGESASRSVVVTLARGQITAVTLDPQWAAGAASTEIGAEVLAALKAAQRNAGDIKDVPMPPALKRLQELAGDPESLTRQLGLSK